jgi:hypothetical protein
VSSSVQSRPTQPNTRAGFGASLLSSAASRSCLASKATAGLPSTSIVKISPKGNRIVSSSLRSRHDCETSFNGAFKHGFESGLCQHFIGRAKGRDFLPFGSRPRNGKSRHRHGVGYAQFAAIGHSFDIFSESVHFFAFSPSSTSPAGHWLICQREHSLQNGAEANEHHEQLKQIS